jgi:hypothetical protein
MSGVIMENRKPVVRFGLPFYNGERCLTNAVDSLSVYTCEFF